MIRTKGEAGTGEGEREREGRRKFCAESNLPLLLHQVGWYPLATGGLFLMMK